MQDNLDTDGWTLYGDLNIVYMSIGCICGYATNIFVVNQRRLAYACHYWNYVPPLVPGEWWQAQAVAFDSNSGKHTQVFFGSTTQCLLHSRECTLLI